MGDKIYFHQKQNSRVTMRGMNEYNTETGTWRQVMMDMSEQHTSNTHMIHAPSMENPHQILIVNIYSARFCDFSKQNVTCSPSIPISSVYGNSWSKERNEFYYYSFTDNSMVKVSAVTNTASKMQRKLKEPKKMNKHSGIIYSKVQYNALDDALYYTVFELSGRGETYQCHLARMNVTNGEDELVYEMCLDKDGSCRNFGQAMYVMSDGAVLTIKGNEQKNKLVRFASATLPTPKPRPVDPNITWLFVMGGVIAAVVVLGVLVTVGIAAKTAFKRNGAYVSV
jgi:hypothetical protein